MISLELDKLHKMKLIRKHNKKIISFSILNINKSFCSYYIIKLARALFL